MTHFVGLDVSVKETSVCVVDDAGKVILEQKVPTEPADIIALLASLGATFGRIGIGDDGWGEFVMTADPVADQRQGRSKDCTAPSFSSHHEAACADLEEKREPRVGHQPKRKG